jgi:hypothetical protein
MPNGTVRVDYIVTAVFEAFGQKCKSTDVRYTLDDGSTVTYPGPTFRYPLEG